MSPLSIECGMLSGDRLRAESSNESSDEDKKSQCVAWGGMPSALWLGCSLPFIIKMFPRSFLLGLNQE